MERNGQTLTEVLEQVNGHFSAKELCKMTLEQKGKYSELIQHCTNVNSDQAATTKEKGEVLEQLASHLLETLSAIFKIDNNLKTNTNEMDIFVSLSPAGKLLQSNGLINPLYDQFIVECKNYSKKIDVTYVGKFCSLLLTNQIQLGILISYHGVTGRNWSDASGLIKKFYLHKEDKEKRYCIIDFNLKDFKKIGEGENFLEIVEEKLLSLQLDTDYSRYLSKQDAE